MSATEQHPRDQLLRYMDRDLDPAERAAVEEHLAGCPDCREWCDAYSLMAALAPGAAPEDGAGEHPSADALARSALAPETLDAEVAAAVGEHLEGCEDCREEARLVAAGVAATAAAAPERWRRWVLPLAATLVAAAGLFALTRLPPSAQVVPPSRELAGATLTGRQVIEASEQVEVFDTEISAGSEVVLRVGEVASFGEGFSVGDSASFSVEIVALGERDDLDSG